MKEGYIINNWDISEGDDCIVVDNYFKDNKVVNATYQYDFINEVIDENSIGVWKVKTKNPIT